MRQALHTGVFAALLVVLSGSSARLPAQAAPAATPPQLTSPRSSDARKAVLTDADHLVQLARELKASVDKTRRDELSLQVIREADEIEKLARSVKARIH